LRLDGSHVCADSEMRAGSVAQPQARRSRPFLDDARLGKFA